MTSFLNLAAYKFVTLTELSALRQSLREKCLTYELKGTVLLTPEGINMFVAGRPDEVDHWLGWLRQVPEFADLEVKESHSDYQPFSRMLVKIKREIISFGVEGIEPARRTSPKLTAVRLKQWLDEGRPLTLLDVRNGYEVEVGTFAGAVPIGVEHFRDFPEAVKALPEEFKERPLVMFCTGGIRCEKAGPYLEREGYRDVFQLEGGILKYFETVGGSHFIGECFVFDQRVAVKPSLEESEAVQCFACQAVLSASDQQSDQYIEGEWCPHCYQPRDVRLLPLLEKRNRKLQELIHPLPGSTPYDNLRPINIPLSFDQATIYDCLCGLHPHVGRDIWLDIFAASCVLFDGIPVNANRIVRAGERFEHLFPATIEPDVSTDICILWEDEAILAINKPAPLPVHPCGRFNRNTLTSFLKRLYEPQSPNSVHRLDANTTGLIVFSRTRKMASLLQPQFEQGRVKKKYLALVHGHPPHDHFFSQAPIGEASSSSRVRIVAENGQAAKTDSTVLRRNSDGTSLLEVSPLTGRTNQIRVHLWHEGFPIVGDPVYLLAGELGETHTLNIDQPPMCLHSWQLGFEHPSTREAMNLIAPPPVWAI